MGGLSADLHATAGEIWDAQHCHPFGLTDRISMNLPDASWDRVGWRTF